MFVRFFRSAKADANRRYQELFSHNSRGRVCRKFKRFTGSSGRYRCLILGNVLCHFTFDIDVFSNLTRDCVENVCHMQSQTQLMFFLNISHALGAMGAHTMFRPLHFARRGTARRGGGGFSSRRQG